MKKGFTLAEVLITLAIIGVVAALTIPTVIRNYQERQTVSALKKFYSQISQAFKLAEIENGTIDTWDWTNNLKILDTVVPYLKVTKKCGHSAGCFAKTLKTLSGGEWYAGTNVDNSAYAKARLADGTSFWIAAMSAQCTENRNKEGSFSKDLANICGEIGVDINGNKFPNVLGKDTFWFYITKYGVIPAGMTNESRFAVTNNCRMQITEKGYNGAGCAAWVISKDNMDYLRGNVNW